MTHRLGPAPPRRPSPTIAESIVVLDARLSVAARWFRPVPNLATCEEASK